MNEVLCDQSDELALSFLADRESMKRGSIKNSYSPSRTAICHHSCHLIVKFDRRGNFDLSGDQLIVQDHHVSSLWGGITEVPNLQDYLRRLW